MPSKVWDEITYTFWNFNDCTVEVWEWVSKFIPHFKMDVIIFDAGIKVNQFRKRGPGNGITKYDYLLKSLLNDNNSLTMLPTTGRYSDMSINFNLSMDK